VSSPLSFISGGHDPLTHSVRQALRRADNSNGPLFSLQQAAIHTCLLRAQGFIPGGGVAAGVALAGLGF